MHTMRHNKNNCLSHTHSHTHIHTERERERERERESATHTLMKQVQTECRRDLMLLSKRSLRASLPSVPHPPPLLIITIQSFAFISFSPKKTPTLLTMHGDVIYSHIAGLLLWLVSRALFYIMTCLIVQRPQKRSALSKASHPGRLSHIPYICTRRSLDHYFFMFVSVSFEGGRPQGFRF